MMTITTIYLPSVSCASSSMGQTNKCQLLHAPSNVKNIVSKEDFSSHFFLLWKHDVSICESFNERRLEIACLVLEIRGMCGSISFLWSFTIPSQFFIDSEMSQKNRLCCISVHGSSAMFLINTYKIIEDTISLHSKIDIFPSCCILVCRFLRTKCDRRWMVFCWRVTSKHLIATWFAGKFAVQQFSHLSRSSFRW